ncbi:long-chain-fatty-acid--CoA ligase [Luteitalea sp. TBR-22]|uniref:class I adenylate-forming enzyme family protein n=1 Tax=Luteitalea sp. TBR-22 TaxID=2802971 RepID=UPI001AF0E0CE|nr:AMP-binding protein [Luteitalea sp. TBR-22]BCS32806.1 long-chain-fatty-acid--CoA ligase [Luteitalea sp. TBR-22]
MSLLSLYDLSLLGRPDTPALEFDAGGVRRAFTFGDLEARSNRWAHLLAARGVAPGDLLAFCLPNRPAVIDLWIAAIKRGVILVPINVLYRGREIGHILADAAPRAVVTTADRVGDFAGLPVWDVDVVEAEAGTHPAERVAVRADAATPAALVYTSGTTGVAKGAVLTQGNFAANALALLAAWDITHADRYLAALPLFHVHGLGNGVQCWLASGCHMRLVERFEHDKAVGWFEEYRPTLFFGVPTMYVRLLETPAAQAQAIGARMRLFVSGSAPLPAQVLEAFAARFGHVILERYGMTETLMNVSNPLVGERRPGTVGLPLPMTAVRILDDGGAPVGTDETGELWVQGPNVCAGYWNRPEATAAAFVDGWFRTGDLGCRAADGYITLQGRRSDLIIAGGFNIYPREIEEVLTTLPGVREAAVVGVPDAVRGEVPVAYLVGQGIDTSAVEAALRAQVASFKVPRAFVVVDALPRTALGKVQKHLLPPVDTRR